MILQVEAEAKLCPSTPTCSGDARSTARPLTTLRSARRTSGCSSWRCGASKTPRSYGAGPSPHLLPRTGPPRHQLRPGLAATVSTGSICWPSTLSPAVVAWRGPWGATNGTAGTHEVPCHSSAPACSTSSVPAQGAGGEGSRLTACCPPLASLWFGALQRSRDTTAQAAWGNPESRQNPAARCKVHQDNPHPTSHPKPSPQDVCRIFVSPEVPRFHLGPGTDHHPTRCKRLLVVEIADWRSAKCCPVLLCLQPTTSPPAVHLPCRVSITLKAYISSQELM